MNLFPILFAVLVGMAVSMQPAVNQVAAKVLGSPAAAASVSVAITLVLSIIFLFLRGEGISGHDVARLPWWVLVGGTVGFLFVLGGVMIAPVTGAAVFFVCLVAGQVFGAAIIDQFGFFQMPLKQLNVMRMAGLGFVLMGVILVVTGSRS